MTVVNAQKIQAVLVRKRAHFGAPVTFTNAPENLLTNRPQKDTNLTLQRRELDQGVQAVSVLAEGNSQTEGFESSNAVTQYLPEDFINRQDGGDLTAAGGPGSPTSLDDKGGQQMEALAEFLSKQSVSLAIEESLQQNETIDAFIEDFASLGEGDLGLGSKTQLTIKEVRNFHDVTYTKNKRVPCVQWVPNDDSMLACSYMENAIFDHKLDEIGKATTSTVLLWSFHDSLAPHAALLAPWDVISFAFCPADRHYVVGGLSSGQMIVWRLTDFELGALRQQGKGETVVKEEDKGIPQVVHRCLSTIDDSHRKPVVAVEWLPPEMEMERKGAMSRKGDPQGLNKYLISTAGDGQILVWDFKSVLDAIMEGEIDTFQWKPSHKVQLQRQDSGTEMGLCQLLPCVNSPNFDHQQPVQASKTMKEEEENEEEQLEENPKEEDEAKEDEKGETAEEPADEEDEAPKPVKKKEGQSVMIHGPTNFYASTEESELVYGDWAAFGTAEKKAEYVKSFNTTAKSFRPMLALERSPYFPDILLGVTDWGFSLWKTGVTEPLFQSGCAASYFSCGGWSATRPSVLLAGRLDGTIDVWDFADQSHKASLTHQVASVALTSMAFQPCGQHAPNHNQVPSEHFLAIGDEQGHLHVLSLPKNLVKHVNRERHVMDRLLDREEARVLYFKGRRAALELEKEEQEKKRGMGGTQEDEVEHKEADEEAAQEAKRLAALEAAYQKILVDFCEANEIGM